jgi:signal peptidase I
MEPALKSGDYIIVSKLIPGPRVFKNFDFLESNSKPLFWRLKGFRAIKRNDVLVFNFPYSSKNKMCFDVNLFYVKRCVAIPGDTFYIDNGIYKVKGCTDALGNIENQKRIMQSSIQDLKSVVYNTFPKGSAINWNIKYFGPLYVPRSGDCLKINMLNVKLYKKLIEYETGQTVKEQGDVVLLNDSCINSYTFKINYYFMAGDLVFDSKDSRYWGLLPEDHIVGKASVIWKSADPYSGDIRWDRVMKAVK